MGGQGDERWVGEQGGERAQVRDSEWLGVATSIGCQIWQLEELPLERLKKFLTCNCNSTPHQILCIYTMVILVYNRLEIQPELALGYSRCYF